ncbi:carbohydrate porin [Erythrobacter sp. NE805]|uniref:carbohydrate porin n=1 Tax=Erythrobacter sp. NE805 TaxID=3389875 RepID=UPI00396B0E13
MARLGIGRGAPAAGVMLAAALLGAEPALAEEREPEAAEGARPVLALSGEYILDAVAVVRGADAGVRYVDLATLTAEVDLEAAAGWRGGSLVAEVIAGTGQRPNDLAGTLQGINNSEVPDNRVKLYQFYLSQALAGGAMTLRAGFIDLNAEFYSNEAAGLLIAPAFGIGSELAATGPNGPAIFPSTALTAAVRVAPSRDTYAAFALVNAEAGVLGDVGGMAPLLKEGALLIGEGGWTGGAGKVALGAWSYTRRQDDIRLVDAAGDPLRRRAHGGYLLLEWPVGGVTGPEPDAPRKASLFLRAGVSDGDTTPYRGGWQAGVLVNAALPGRPDSQLSFGANQAFLSDKFRLNHAEAGNPMRGAETGVELTLADTLAPWLTVQADAQYVRNPGRAAGTRDAVILGLRFIFAFSREW